MVTIDELSKLRYINLDIQKLRERRAELKLKVASPTAPNISDTPGTRSHENWRERCIAEIVDLEATIDDKFTQSIHEQLQLARFIFAIPDSRLRLIFTYRFWDLLSWKAVAKKLGNEETADTVKKAVERYLKKKHQ